MRTALCGIVRNEQSSVAQWIAYHRLLGFDTVLLVDDASTDDTVAVAGQAAMLHDVRISALLETGPDRQCRAYARIAAQHADEFDWIAFLDLDEYLVPHREQTLQQMLAASPQHAGLAIPWLMFGSSGHVAMPDGLVVERFQHRGPLDFGPNRHVKSIIRPSSLRGWVNPHCFDLHGTLGLCDGTPVDWQSPGVLHAMPGDSPWYVHHYFTRSRTHWARRLERGQFGGWLRTWDDFVAYDRNEVFDPSALHAVPALGTAVDRILCA